MKPSELRQLIREEISKALNENIGFSTIDRMSGLANVNDLRVLETKLRALTADWLEEGFEKDDVIGYLTWFVEDQI